MIYSCCSSVRQTYVLGNPVLNGLDYLEVLDTEAPPLGLPRQQVLVLHCLKDAPLPTITTDNILITGGESITGITAAWVATPATLPSTLPFSPPVTLTSAAEAYFKGLSDAKNVIIVGTSVAGDFSTYTLSLVNDAATAAQSTFGISTSLDGFDPQLTQVCFSFKVECGPNFDCAPLTPPCAPDLPTTPPINYLAKDYGSFRTIMLDRLNQLLPNWGATSEADMGIALTELVAYVGDRLSYYQDAVATEAYLATARRRVSLRRHAMLVDYHVHDGCNARAWVQVTTNANAGTPVFLDRTVTRFYTYAPGMPGTLAVGANQEPAALIAGVQVFEPLADALVSSELAEMKFYTWGNSNCCLPQGATEATLIDTYTNLQPGDVLIFKEVKGPLTGVEADADIRHRCAVRLTAVLTQDSKGKAIVDPLIDTSGNAITGSGQTAQPITEIQWAQEDALPFPVCISSTYLDEDSDSHPVDNVSIALGNIVLADHGLTMPSASLGTVPPPAIYYPNTSDRCSLQAATPVPPRYNPQIPETPITQAVPVTSVALANVGNPVTPAGKPVPLTGVSIPLSSSSGFVALTLQISNYASWPAFFGVKVVPNTSTHGNIDLSVVYNPPGGAAGFDKLITLESFTDLSLHSADANFAVTEVNAKSQLIRLAQPAGAPDPTAFPAAPAMLSTSGAVNLEDTSATPVTYLTVEPTAASGWPALFGAEAGPNANPTYFDLSIVYNPASGAVGVAPFPAIVEQFTNLSPATAADEIDSESALVTVQGFAQSIDPTLAAADLMNLDASTAIPAITLSGTLNNVTSTWTPLQNLLASGEEDTTFVVEVEADNTATLRFGDDTNGLTPPSGTTFTTVWRVGNGTAGNVGAESLTYLAAGDARITGCSNPMPASGGTDPETNAQIQRRAPQQFLTQERAITMPDYVTVAESNALVRNAVASQRWTGSWYTVFIAAEPVTGSQTGTAPTGGTLTAVQQKSVTATVNSFRLAGEDIQLDSPQYVSLQIVLTICVDPDYFNLQVQRALNQVLSSGPGGLFNSANFTFGQNVYLSPIYAAARAVPGVNAVTATTFQIQGVTDNTFLANGEIPLGPLQIARLENNPSYPNHGQLTLNMEGGK
ncbi:MAG: putative baseplate assembly protein [Acidobacteriaceae bacterium]